ncbi:solute carrier family 23 member 3 isoform X7 [Canis lupus familiaris]|uniref:solute carrier family 23 member 3 isoform X4 n=1 Tax=Canis lupus dingo TaxID=286419 RepID=UPI000DC69709|nr:solute carrier family 23 member 3 isoform X4 [Canis lupus dingo]XP_038441712.1 solute carrier family 23 member 3 isoform X7 [Canis lupus familiaris]
MSRSPHHPIQLRSMDLQDALAPLPLSSSPLPPPLPPPQSAVQNPSSHLWASQCGPPPWGLSCLLALQHILVLASLLCASHLLLLQGLPPGELSSSPAQLLASSFFSCGVSTILQIWIGSRLPLVQAPSLEFLVPALVLTQKLPLAIQTPGNSSLVLRRCGGPGCPGLALWNTSLREVSGAVVVSGLLQGTLGLLGGPGHLFPHCGPLVLAPSLVVAGFSAHREVALFCSTHWGLALLTWAPARYPRAPGGQLQTLHPTLPFLSSGSSRYSWLHPPRHHGSGCLTQAGSRRVAHLAGLLCVGLGLSPRLAQLLTAIPLPVLGGVLGVTQAVVLSTGFSSFHLADIDSGRNVFIVGFSIFMALLLPRWLREAPVLMSTGWSPLDVLLRSLLTEPIFLAGLLGFLLENTIPGTRLERGLGQGMPSPFAAPKAQMPEKSREKGAKEYELPFPIQKLHPCIPQPLRCLCPLPEDPGNEEGGPSEPGETADLLPGFGEQCPESSRELGSQ